jgi:hypothetical protein
MKSLLRLVALVLTISLRAAKSKAPVIAPKGSRDRPHAGADLLQEATRGNY